MRYLTLFLLFASSAFAAIIPTQRLSEWVEGVDVGVPGGIAQYMPGGASQRTTLLNVVSTYGADNTGATDTRADIQAAIDAAASGEVVWFPAGVYRIDASMGVGYKDNITIRGAGQYALSTSSNSFGTGLKTFTVDAGLGYTAGCGVWVWVWDRDFVPITSITRSSATATVTTGVPHYMVTGQWVQMKGATQTEYNVYAEITVTGATTFTYSVSGSPVTPATGSFMFAGLCETVQIASITRSGSTATVTTSSAHRMASNEVVTISGASQSEYNITATITVTSGTTFTYVVSGSPATPATGTMLAAVNSQDGPNMWMKGTCDSYSGTTLVVDVASIQGYGTFGMWKVGVTTLDYRGSGGSAIAIGGDGNNDFYQSTNVPTQPSITGSPTRGATSIDVDDRTAFSSNQLMQIAAGNQTDPNAGAVGDSTFVVHVDGYNYLSRQMVRIGTVTPGSGTTGTITFSPELMLDLPTGLAPKALTTSLYSELVGVENLAVFGHDATTSSPVVSITQGISCWLYRVSVHSVPNYNIGISANLKTEIRECWATHRNGAGTNGAALLPTWSANALVTHSIFGFNRPEIEQNSGCVSMAYSYNYISKDGMLNTNHAPHPRFTLLEGNLAPYVLSDGYFGGESELTALRNWLYGYNQAFVIYGGVFGRRWSYNFNPVGNILGTAGFADGANAWGQPNIGNGAYSGTASAINGDWWLHYNPPIGGIPATLSTRTNDTDGVITMTTLTASDIEDPNLASNYYVNMAYRWSPYTDYQARGGSALSISNISGSTFDVTGGSGVNPDEDTAIRFFPGQSGYQEWDNDVEGTVNEKGNWLVVGTGGSQQSTGGDTIPDAYSSLTKPSLFGVLSWPLNPASPNFGDGLAVIPATYLALNGVLPPEDSGTSTATVSGTTTVTGTLTPP